MFPVIGPVRPPVGAGGFASPYSNVTVQGCTGNKCTVQINAAGPMDPYGTAYTYTWSGPFGSVPGINPTVLLPAGTIPVTLSVSDPYGTVLTTATMDVTVVNPNPPGGGKGKEKKHDKDDRDHDKKKGHEKSDGKHHHDD